MPETLKLGQKCDLGGQKTAKIFLAIFVKRPDETSGQNNPNPKKDDNFFFFLELQ